MTHNIFWQDAVASGDIECECSNCSDLRVRIGLPILTLGIGLPSRMDDLDANGALIDKGASVPTAFSGMPRVTVFVHQSIDHGFGVIGHNVMRADVTIGERHECTGLCRGGVVQYDDIDAAILST